MSNTTFQRQLLAAVDGIVPDAFVIAHDLGNIDYAAGSDPTDRLLNGPPGLRAKILGVQLTGVEVFSANDADATIEFGDGSDADEYGDIGAIGELAANTSEWYPLVSGSWDDAVVPADLAITMTFTDGSTPTTGQAITKVYVAYFL